MADSQRIEDLRRRVQKDPASIAFAQLAEECRRAGHLQEAVETCRAGLAIHPGYLSARVTLGRALLELNELDDALAELELVLKGAPENLSAIRGVAEIQNRRGNLSEALDQYRAALALARNDPDLERTVDELARKVQPTPKAPVVTDGLSLAQIEEELFKIAPPPPPVTPPAAPSAASPPPAFEPPPLPVTLATTELALEAPGPDPDSSAPATLESASTSSESSDPGDRLRAERTIAALEAF